MSLAIKICGQTRLEESLACAEAGATHLGFIFYPKSKRYLPWEAARPWLGQLAGRAVRVGVFVDAPLAEVQAVLASGLIDAAQLHGAEDRAYAASLPGPLVKALRVAAPLPLEALEGWGAADFLLDGPEPGSGRVFDWAHAAAAVAARPQDRFFLAGGLTPDNVAAAIAAVRPWGIDVASGVEAAPGRKDMAKVRAFIAAARQARAA